MITMLRCCSPKEVILLDEIVNREIVNLTCTAPSSFISSDRWSCVKLKTVKKKAESVLDVREKMQIGDGINIEVGRERKIDSHSIGSTTWFSLWPCNTANGTLYFTKTE
jgi:hypothetical protein